MAYTNPFSYNRDSSVDSKYKYIADLSKFKPIYGSSVSFSSRLNYLQTVDNELKILPASENNLVVKYNLKFLLNNSDVGDLLKTIEIAGGYRYLKFIDPSNFYKDIIGLVEDYSISKNSQNLNEINIIVASYFKAPIFNWKTSSFFNIDSSVIWSSSKSYSKYDFVFNPIPNTSKNKLDDFWFANKNILPGNFNLSDWSKDFIFETKLPFELRNKLDIYQLDYKNSFIQNIKHKSNSNTLKEYTVKFENIDDKECISILFFLEKKCGYRRFVYKFPFLLKSSKVFICRDWIHSFKYLNCNDITATFVEEPNPNMDDFYLNGEYNGLNFTQNTVYGFYENKLYIDLQNEILAGTQNQPFKAESGLWYSNGVLKNGASNLTIVNSSNYFINGEIKGPGIATDVSQNSEIFGNYFKEDGSPLLTTSSITNNFIKFNSNDINLNKYNNFYLNGSIFEVNPIQDSVGTKIFVYDGAIYDLNGNLYTGIFDNLLFIDGKIKLDNVYYSLDKQGKVTTGNSAAYYVNGYPSQSWNGGTGSSEYFFISSGKLYRYYNIPGQVNFSTELAEGFKIYNGILYLHGYKFCGNYNSKAYFLGRLYTGTVKDYDASIYVQGVFHDNESGSLKYYGTFNEISKPLISKTKYYKDGILIPNSDSGTVYNNYFYKYGYRIISTGYYNGDYYLNGVKQ